MAKQKIRIKVNGADMEADVESRLLLVHCIRDVFGLTGTHIGCDTTHCGACTVHLDGKPIKSCTLFAVQADGCEIKTVEGLEQDGKLHPVQEGFWQEHGLQCGFCTPGMMMTSVALLEEKPNPTEDEIRLAISGNLCRCTGYMNIVKSIQYAAQKLQRRSLTGRKRHAQDKSGNRRDGSFGKAQRGCALYPREGELCRRCSASGNDLVGHRAEPLCPRQNQQHRYLQSPGHTGSARRDHGSGSRQIQSSLDADSRCPTLRWCCRWRK